jgi:hypothetical protein
MEKGVGEPRPTTEEERMTEMQTLEIRFSGRLLAACRDKRGAVKRLIYHADNDY